LLFCRNDTFLKKPIRSHIPSIDDVRSRKNVKCQEDSNKKEKPQTSLLLLLSWPSPKNDEKKPPEFSIFWSIVVKNGHSLA
jgi:hypothetical protein